MPKKKKKSERKEKKSKFSFLSGIRKIFNKYLRRQKSLKLGIYGTTNAGKTTLANRISSDWSEEEVGSVSNIPHETRQVQIKENLVIESEDGRKLSLTLLDTPGIATKIDYEDFVKHGIKKKAAKERAREATQGIIESIKYLDDMDVVLAIMDATKSPYDQVNITILGNLEARDIPVIIVGNKTDLKNADINKIKKAFPQYSVVGISAKKGDNIEDLYKAIFKTI